MNLPALSIQIKGEVVTTNLPEFNQAATAFIVGINTNLQSDEDFVEAESNIKICSEAESVLESAKNEALANVADINSLLLAIDTVKNSLRDKRLLLEKTVKKRKDDIKIEILSSVGKKWKLLVAELNKKTDPVNLELTPPNFESAIKGKKTKEICIKSVDEMFEQHKENVFEMANDIVFKLEWLNESFSDYKFLFNDLQRLAFRDLESFKELVSTRVETYKQKKAADDAKLVEDTKRAAEQHSQAKPVTPEVKPAMSVAKPVMSEARVVTSELAKTTPSMDEIIATLQTVYGVDRLTVVEWLFSIDYEKLSDELLG